MNSFEFELYKTNPPNSLSMKHISSLLCLSMATESLDWNQVQKSACLDIAAISTTDLQKDLVGKHTNFIALQWRPGETSY